MLAVLILSFVLGIALGTSIIFIRQSKTLRELGYSVVAFYAADSGVEAVLYKDKSCYPPACSTSSPPVYCTSVCRGLIAPYTTSTILSNEASYDVTFSTSTTGTTTIKSIGAYKNTSRAIEVVY